MDPSIVIAGASFALSLFVLWRQHAAAGRANLIAEWSSSDQVAFVNLGPGAAREVTASVEREESREDWTKGIPYMPSGQMNELMVVRAYGEVLAPLQLSWKDNRFRRQSIIIELPDPPRSAPRPASPQRSDLEKQVRQMARDEITVWEKETVRRIRANRRTRRRG